MEAVWAAAAVVVTTVGGLGTTVYQAGQTQAQIANVRAAQKATDARVQSHDEQLSAIKEQNARIEQKLTDVASDVHDMHENGVKRK